LFRSAGGTRYDDGCVDRSDRRTHAEGRFLSETLCKLATAAGSASGNERARDGADFASGHVSRVAVRRGDHRRPSEHLVVDVTPSGGGGDALADCVTVEARTERVSVTV